MDHDPDAVRVQSPFGRPREPSILVVVIAAFLLIAILKPWSFGEDGPDAGRPGAGAIPFGSGPVSEDEPSPASSPSILDPNAMACMTDATEQVVIIERWAGHEVRSWVAAADMTVSEPLDERLVPISIFTSHVIGLGICASRDLTGTQQPAARLLDVQSIVQAASGPLAVDLGRPDPITVQLRGPEPALLYGAPAVTLPGSPASPSRPGPLADPTATGPAPGTSTPGMGLPSPTDAWATWPTGSYAIEFAFPSDGPNVMRWLRIDLIPGAGAAG